MKTKLSPRHYWHPTPKKWRRIGDAILYGCGAIGASGLMAFDQLKEIFSPNELKWIIGSVLLLGFLGKFLSNFFKDEKTTDPAAGDNNAQ